MRNFTQNHLIARVFETDIFMKIKGGTRSHQTHKALFSGDRNHVTKSNNISRTLDLLLILLYRNT